MIYDVKFTVMSWHRSDDAHFDEITISLKIEADTVEQARNAFAKVTLGDFITKGIGKVAITPLEPQPAQPAQPARLRLITCDE